MPGIRLGISLAECPCSGPSFREGLSPETQLQYQPLGQDLQSTAKAQGYRTDILQACPELQCSSKTWKHREGTDRELVKTNGETGSRRD